MAELGVSIRFGLLLLLLEPPPPPTYFHSHGKNHQPDSFSQRIIWNPIQAWYIKPRVLFRREIYVLCTTGGEN